jgi:hypothetical protein
MKTVLVSLTHICIWSVFSLVIYLSQRDKLQSKMILFLFFLYFAYVVAHYIMQRKRQAVASTIANSSIFFFIKEIVQYFYRL